MGSELSPEAYEELVGQTVDILTVIDDSGVIQYESPSVARITGYDPGELEGETVFEYIHPDDRQKALDMFYENIMASEPRSESIEIRFRHKDGSWVWLEARGSTQQATTLEGYVISSRDITERKEFERKLTQERDRLDRFASVVSHDLRNPLTVIEGRLELAQEDCESEHLDAIEGSLDRVNELIEDLLTVAREGETEPLLDTISLRETAKTCYQNIDSKASTLNIETEQTIVADESQSQQVFENLFRNAIEHGGKDVTITVGDLDDGFYVEDDGRGIPEDARDALLEYGFSTKTDGTGFGLTIVNNIVENHDWGLNVTEGTDGGARFEFRDVTFA